MRGSSNDGCVGWLVIILVFLVGSYFVTSHTQQVTFTVDSKERVCDGGTDGTCRYLVYTTNGGVYENSDSMWWWKWNSGNVQAELRVGHTYTAKVAGYRIPFLSWRQNIVSLKEVPADDSIVSTTSSGTKQ